jgi:hypothetical protein
VTSGAVPAGDTVVLLRCGLSLPTWNHAERLTALSPVTVITMFVI